MAKTETFADDFSFEDAAKWTHTGAAIVAGGQASFTPAGGSAERDSVTGYDLTGSSLLVEGASVAATGGNWLVAYPGALNGNSFLAIFRDGPSGNLVFRENVSGVPDNTTVTYDPVAHRWWRLREAGGTLFWDTSPDGVTWTNGRSKVTGLTYTSCFVQLYVDGASGTTLFDNLNVAPAVYSYKPTQIPNGKVGPMAQRQALRGRARWAARAYEIPLPGVDYTETDTDPVGAADFLITDSGRASIDPVGTTDTVAVTQDWVRTQTDLLGTTDSATSAQGFDRSATDTAGITDGTAIEVSTGATDPVGLGDGATLDAGRSAADLDGIGDSSTVQQDWVRTPADLLGAVDSLGLAATRDATEPVGLADDGSAVQDWARTASDQIAANDSSVLAQDWARSPTDLVGVTDTSAATTDFVRASTDSVNAADALATVANYQRAPADPEDLTDDATFVLTAPGEANADELIDVSDSAVIAFSGSRSATDTVGATDSANTQSTRGIADDLGVTDTTGFIAEYVRSLTDPVGVADSATFTITVAAADTATVADTARLDRDTQLVDTADLTDAAVFATAYVQALADPVGVTDSATFQLGDNVRTVVDPVGATDSVLVDIFTAPGPDNTWVVRPESVTAGLPAESTSVALSESVTAAARGESTTHAMKSETNVMEV